MKAAVLTEPAKPIEIWTDVEIQPPGPGTVQVRVHACGVCHSDLSIVDGVFPGQCPVILGHEAAGVVEEVGPGVTGVSPGDHVVLSPCPPCGRCYYCVRGEPGVCVETIGIMTGALPDGSTGLSRGGETIFRGVNVAAFAERVNIPANGAVKIPDDVPLDVACVIGCAVQTGAGAVLNTAGVEQGATLLVMGLGGIGLSMVQGARIAGASKIIVSDPVADRREQAGRFGATHFIDPNSDDVVQRCLELTGVGVDYAFDAAGAVALVQTGVAATRPGGTTVCVGVPGVTDPIHIDSAPLFIIQEKKVMGCTLGSCNSLLEIPRMIDLWKADRLDLEGMISHRRPLDQINEAMADLRDSNGIRTVLQI